MNEHPHIIGVDVGGTFTDLIHLDPATGAIGVVKVPSTPPEFHLAVLQAVHQAMRNSPDAAVKMVHGSTVATNALLQRTGEPVAFITTEGFRDMLLIGRQNRPKLYALHVQRPTPITPDENWFTVRERIDAHGGVITPLDEGEIDRLVKTILSRGLRHAAVCLLFSFVNAEHERRLGAKLEAAGITTSLSCDVLPEFREYERASTTAINASLRPTVAAYLAKLREGLNHESLIAGGGSPGFMDAAGIRAFGVPQTPTWGSSALQIMHSGGGTLSVDDAAKQAAKLVLSGPAGGVIGAAFVAATAGFKDVITYDMGGTSTDVALVLDGQPQWTNGSSVDGLPLGLPAFDIHTVGAGGGSIAFLDAGGALRVGPRSAEAAPGPACYGRGGVEPTVTDANVVLGRILPDQFLGGAMTIEIDQAVRAIQPLAAAMGKSLIDAALGIVRVAEAAMASAVRAVTSQRGQDTRRFSLVSFGGAGGLHACAIAEALDIPRVMIPPYCGVLSALGMAVAKPVADVSQTVVHESSTLDDAKLQEYFDQLAQRSASQLPEADTDHIERFADVRFKGQSYELKVPVETVSFAAVGETFTAAYTRVYHAVPTGRSIEIVTLRLRRTGRGANVSLPTIEPDASPVRRATVVLGDGSSSTVPAFTRATLRATGETRGPLQVIDATATVFVPGGWTAVAGPDGMIVVSRA